MSTTPGFLAPGDVLRDRYTLRSSAWTSPLGPVWEARDNVLNRPVFVQMLGEHLRSAGVERMFQRQAAAIAQVQHTALLRVFDIGDDPPFMVVEHAGGGRLSDRLARSGMRTQDAVRGALSLARGLETLHQAGLVHGSLSPTNVLLDTEGGLRLMAVGAAATTAGVDGIDAGDEQPEGYQPPEGAAGEDADRYALAALTYHMLTGRPPGKAGARRIAMPGGLVSLLQRALGPDPAKRPSLDSFVAGLAPFARVEIPKARRSRVVASEFRWLTPVIVIVVLAVLAVTLGVSLVQQFADRTPAPAPSPTDSVATGGRPAEVAEVTVFDPHGGGDENVGNVGRVIDGDVASAWRTFDYADIGLEKPGVGVLLDLGEPVTLTRVQIQTELPGWRAQIRIADEPGEDEEAFERIDGFRAQTDTQIAVPTDTQARYVLVWITRLVAHNGDGVFPHRAEIGEVTVFTA